VARGRARTVLIWPCERGLIHTAPGLGSFAAPMIRCCAQGQGEQARRGPGLPGAPADPLLGHRTHSPAFPWHAASLVCRFPGNRAHTPACRAASVPCAGRRPMTHPARRTRPCAPMRGSRGPTEPVHRAWTRMSHDTDTGASRHGRPLAPSSGSGAFHRSVSRALSDRKAAGRALPRRAGRSSSIRSRSARPRGCRAVPDDGGVPARPGRHGTAGPRPPHAATPA